MLRKSFVSFWFLEITILSIAGSGIVIHIERSFDFNLTRDRRAGFYDTMARERYT